MRQTFLLAAQHLREQRWALASLLVYIVLMALAFGGLGGSPSSEDLLFFTRQQASFCVLFTLFLAASALHAERRSRRLLAVLSKAISRRLYIRSILFAMWAAAIAYCAVASVGLLWLRSRGHTTVESDLVALWVACIAAVTTASIAVFFSTFIHPLLSTFFTAALVVVPTYLGQMSAAWFHVSPASALMAHATGMIVLAGSSSLGYWISLSLIQMVVFWAGAAFAFNKLDIAVPME